MVTKNNLLKNSLNNYVVSSRIRLARNVEGYLFPTCISTDKALEVVDVVSKPLADKGFTVHRLKDKTDVEIVQMMESHLISNNLIENRKGSAVCLNASKEVAVMINEEDHIRLQVIMRGLVLEQAYRQASEIDNIICKNVRTVYDERLGFITSCPTNLGTGLRASVMMFLPALHKNDAITQVISNLTMSKMTLRGVYGEGSKADGFMYQLSNQHTLGLNENEIISNVLSCVNRIAYVEEQAREKMYENNKPQLTDTVMRAWGILTNCYKISSEEFMNYIAYIKLGIGLNIIKLSRPEIVDDLITKCQPANLAQIKGFSGNALERDIIRAEYIKEELRRLS